MAQYNQVTPEIVERLQAIAPGRVYTGADVNEDYSRDEMPIYGTRMPDVAIDAMSTEEISAIMKICNVQNFQILFLRPMRTLHICPLIENFFS